MQSHLGGVGHVDHGQSDAQAAHAAVQGAKSQAPVHETLNRSQILANFAQHGTLWHAARNFHSRMVLKICLGWVRSLRAYESCSSCVAFGGSDKACKHHWGTRTCEALRLVKSNSPTPRQRPDVLNIAKQELQVRDGTSSCRNTLQFS